MHAQTYRKKLRMLVEENYESFGLDIQKKEFETWAFSKVEYISYNDVYDIYCELKHKQRWDVKNNSCNLYKNNP